jgi:hypothetical protein
LCHSVTRGSKRLVSPSAHVVSRSAHVAGRTATDIAWPEKKPRQPPTPARLERSGKLDK